jgi:glycosyltransferase involved in cell wall biosynthesis
MKSIQILFVANPGIIHSARWIEQISKKGWDLHLFSPHSTSDLTIHNAIPENVLIHLIVRQKRSAIRQKGLWYPLEKGDRFRQRITDLYEVFRNRANRLAKLIKKIKPDIVHSLEMTGAGYLTLESKKILANENVVFPKWIYSCWGNDLYMYGEMQEHKLKIKNVLENIDYLIADCQRDDKLAKKYGFTGEVLGVYPTGGGFDIDESIKHRQEPINSRKIIALKGLIREDNQGRALNAFKAILKCNEKLKGFEIIVYMADTKISEWIKKLSDLGVNVKIFPPSSHDEFIKLIGRSRISIGMNISDGTPNTMLESMMMGAFPVQSDTVSTAEWIDDGKNGFLVDPDNVDEIAEALVKAVEDDKLIQSAAEINDKLIKSRLERKKIQKEVIDLYEKVYSDNVRHLGLKN